MYICIYVYIYACICIYICIDVCMYIYIYIYVCVYIYIYVCVSVCVFVSVFACIYIYICVRVYKSTCACCLWLCSRNFQEHVGGVCVAFCLCSVCVYVWYGVHVGSIHNQHCLSHLWLHTLAKLPGLGYLAVKIPTHILSVSAFEGWCCRDAVAAVAVAVAVAAADYRLQATGYRLRTDRVFRIL